MRLGEVKILLEQVQADLAEQALTAPSEKNAYGYGFAVGAYNGVGMAWEAIEQMYRDKDEKERDL